MKSALTLRFSMSSEFRHQVIDSKPRHARMVDLMHERGSYPLLVFAGTARMANP